MAVVEYSLFDHRIVTGSGALSALNLDLSARNFQQILVLCDDQTFRCCYPLLLEAAPVFSAAKVFCVPAGESSKNLDAALSVWQEMMRLGMTRNDLLVNLGGGMVSDLGGFVAATYLRGIPFLNVPTSLLAQVDAAIGGKTGVDLYGAKNRVGLTVFPLGVYSDPCFFKSLPDDEWLSGCAEVVKHALIADASLWSLLQRDGLSRDVVSLHLAAIQEVKIAVVQDDPLEKSVRKKLNFGHTIGHAIESSAMEDLQIPLSHGRAVAMGMMLESELAFALQLLSEAALEDIRSSLSHWFGKPDLSAFSADRLVEWMWLDKKNRSGEMGFSFVTGPGRCEFVLLRDVDLLRRVLLANGARS
jgi:3-dehydroquinate synthase